MVKSIYIPNVQHGYRTIFLTNDLLVKIYI